MTPKEYPILYSTPMIQAILNGTKNQTRRIIKPQPRLALLGNGQPIGNGQLAWDAPQRTLAIPFTKGCMNQIIDLCPYGQVGDFTWARETFRECHKKIGPYGLEQNIDYEFSHYEYKADGLDGKWKPSIFMPRAACRIVQENVDIRVERVADISEQDAIAEGIESMIGFGGFTYWKDYEFKPKGELQSASFMSPIQSYKSLWNSINNVPKLNKKTDTYVVYPFDEQSAINVNKAGYWGNTYRNKPLIVVPNPWVWVVEF